MGGVLLRQLQIDLEKDCYCKITTVTQGEPRMTEHTLHTYIYGHRLPVLQAPPRAPSPGPLLNGEFLVAPESWVQSC